MGIEFAEEELECARGEEVGGTVPAHVVEGLELVSDARDGGSDNRVVQGDAKYGYTRGQIDNEELGVAGGCWACSCSMSSRGCVAFEFALPGTLLFMMDGAGEDPTVVVAVEASPFSCIVCPRISIAILIPESY